MICPSPRERQTEPISLPALMRLPTCAPSSGGRAERTSGERTARGSGAGGTEEGAHAAADLGRTAAPHVRLSLGRPHHRPSSAPLHPSPPLSGAPIPLMRQWQQSVTDELIVKTILEGGMAVGKAG